MIGRGVGIGRHLHGGPFRIEVTLRVGRRTAAHLERIGRRRRQPAPHQTVVPVFSEVERFVRLDRPDHLARGVLHAEIVRVRRRDGCCASASDDNSHSSTASPCVLAKIRTDGAISGCGSVVTSCATAASESYSPASGGGLRHHRNRVLRTGLQFPEGVGSLPHQSRLRSLAARSRNGRNPVAVGSAHSTPRHRGAGRRRPADRKPAGAASFSSAKPRVPTFFDVSSESNSALPAQSAFTVKR